MSLSSGLRQLWYKYMIPINLHSLCPEIIEWLTGTWDQTFLYIHRIWCVVTKFSVAILSSLMFVYKSSPVNSHNDSHSLLQVLHCEESGLQVLDIDHCSWNTLYTPNHLYWGHMHVLGFQVFLWNFLCHSDGNIVYITVNHTIHRRPETCSSVYLK